jgi:hypothetical protein
MGESFPFLGGPAHLALSAMKAGMPISNGKKFEAEGQAQELFCPQER